MGPATGPATSELEQARTAPEFGSHTPLAEKLLAVAIRAQNFTGSTGVAIALTEGQEMVCRASWGTSAPDVGAKLSIDHGFTGLCARTGEPLRCDDAETDPRVDAEACRALGISAIAVSPVRRGLKVIGVIAAFSDTPNAFTDKHLLILTTLSEVIIELLDESQPLPAAGKPLAQQALDGIAPAIAVLDHEAVAPAKGVESAAVFEDEESTHLQAPPTIVGPTPHPQRKTSETKQQLESPLVVMTPRPSSANGGNGTPPVDLSEILQETTEEIAPIPVVRHRSPKAEASGSVRLVPLRQPPTNAEPSPELTFSSYEGSEQAPRRWWLLAVILIVFALIAWAVSHWSATRNAHAAASRATAPQSSSSVAQPAASPELKTANPAPPEAKHSAFLPAPALSSAMAPPPKAAPPASKTTAPAEDLEDVTVRRTPEAVIETSAPVRQPAGGKNRAQASSEAQAPQLALSTPELPTVLDRPAPAAPVAAPVSHIVAARLISRIAPTYPDAARRMNLTGKVVLKATINRAGSVGNLQWVSGNEMFRANAFAAVKQWRYRPATLNGQPVESELQIVLEFGLPMAR